MSIDFEWSEKSLVVLEFGYAAIRSAHLDAINVWPPVPEDNYRLVSATCSSLWIIAEVLNPSGKAII